MKLSALITTLKCHKNDKDEIIKKHIFHMYIPIKEKYDKAKLICEKTMYNDNSICVNSFHQYVFTCIIIVQMFTDLQFVIDDRNLFDIYDTLYENNILQCVLNYADSDQIKEFRMILKMVSDDIILNANI